MHLIAEDAARAFLKMFVEQGEKIERAMVTAAEEAQAHETDAKLSIGFTVQVLLDKDQLDYRLTFTEAHKLTASSKMPDPDQLEFPGTEVTVTGPDGASFTLTPDQLAAAAKKLSGKGAK